MPLLALALLGGLTGGGARAEDGHDHGATPAAAAAAALPRFSAVSESFELVGVLDGRQLRVYLDRADDNSPVSGARVELELGGHKLTLQPHGAGEFEAALPAALQPGEYPVTATVVLGAESDLLAGDFDLHESADAAHAADGPAAAAAPVSAWREHLASPAVLATATGVGGLTLGLVVAGLARRRSAPGAGSDLAGVTRGVSA